MAETSKGRQISGWTSEFLTFICIFGVVRMVSYLLKWAMITAKPIQR